MKIRMMILEKEYLRKRKKIIHEQLKEYCYNFLMFAISILVLIETITLFVIQLIYMRLNCNKILVESKSLTSYFLLGMVTFCVLIMFCIFKFDIKKIKSKRFLKCITLIIKLKKIENYKEMIKFEKEFSKEYSLYVPQQLSCEIYKKLDEYSSCKENIDIIYENNSCCYNIIFNIDREVKKVSISQRWIENKMELKGETIEVYDTKVVLCKNCNLLNQ